MILDERIKTIRMISVCISTEDLLAQSRRLPLLPLPIQDPLLLSQILQVLVPDLLWDSLQDPVVAQSLNRVDPFVWLPNKYLLEELHKV